MFHGRCILVGMLLLDILFFAAIFEFIERIPFGLLPLGEPDEGPEKAEGLLRRYDEIIAKAKEEYEYESPSEYFKDGYNLYKRMAEEKERYTLFLHDPAVEPDNNLAERCARKFKRKAAQVMCFRSQDGVDWFCDGLSIIQSIKAAGKNIYEAVKERFNASLEV